ncbi:MAG: phosphoribosylanthranilate isomerase [Thermoanaerobaculia bacterium]
MTRLKICGLTREEDALFAAEHGADFLGFIFVPSTPRFIEPERAAAIAARVKERENPPKIVGVFRDSSMDYVREIAALATLDVAQLHGSETDEDIQRLQMPVIKTFRVGDSLPDTSAHPSAAWLLFDTFDERRGGGTGRRFDWSLLSQYSRSKPFFLSGGIGPDNVAAAISLVRPDGLDVSSSIESEPGVKDHAQMQQLLERVKGT